MVELHQLSRLTNMEPILFVRVPPPGSRTVDTDPPDGAPRGHSSHLLAQAGSGSLHYNNTLLMASTPPSSSHFPEDGERDGGAWPSPQPSRSELRGGGSSAGRGSMGVPPAQTGCGSSSCPVSLGIAAPSLPPPPLSSTHKSHSIDSNGNGDANTNISKTSPRRISSSRGSVPPSTSVEESSGQDKLSQPYHHAACCVHEQLRRLGYIRAPEPSLLEPALNSPTSSTSSSLSNAQWLQVKREHLSTDSHLLERFTDFQSRLARFTRRTLQTYLVNAATVLNNSHTRCLNMFILSAFDMARDMLITPRKLEFAREKEEELYKSLLGISVSKLDEIKELIATTIDVIGKCIVAEAGEFEFIGECRACQAAPAKTVEQAVSDREI